MRSRPQDRGLYRSRSGVICGVCKGLAHHLGVPVWWVRAFAVAALFFTGLWPAAALYFLAAFFMKPEPVAPLHNPEDEAFYASYAGSRRGALHHLKRTYDGLERRLRRLEDRVTGAEFRWEERLRRGR